MTLRLVCRLIRHTATDYAATDSLIFAACASLDRNCCTATGYKLGKHLAK